MAIADANRLRAAANISGQSPQFSPLFKPNVAVLQHLKPDSQRVAIRTGINLPLPEIILQNSSHFHKNNFAGLLIYREEDHYGHTIFN
jgi:hypothetical protein